MDLTSLIMGICLLLLFIVPFILMSKKNKKSEDSEDKN